MLKRGREIGQAVLRRVFIRVSPGSSLMEMVVVLAILSLLAALATPYARMSIKREKEMQLRETLRTVRIAIDRFHADVEGGAGKKEGGASNKENKEISENGYPLSLQVLVDGIDKLGGDKPGEKPGGKKRKRYLRSLPVNPFAPRGTPYEAQWTFVSYQREAPMIASSSYGTTLAEVQKSKDDIYDLHAVTRETALDGTHYAEW